MYLPRTSGKAVRSRYRQERNDDCADDYHSKGRAHHSEESRCWRFRRVRVVPISIFASMTFQPSEQQKQSDFGTEDLPDPDMCSRGWLCYSDYILV